MVWALGVVVIAAITGVLALNAVGTATSVLSTGSSRTAGDEGRSTSAASPVDYYVDVIFRPGPNGPPATAQQSTRAETVGVSPAAQGSLPPEMRAEVKRVVARSVSQGRLDENDRTYLAQLVAARTGVPQDEAQRRVADADSKAREAVKEAADKTAKAGAYFSFWTFMALLFGGAAATLAGMLGGQLRDEKGRVAPVVG
jgi:hypothetical protein